MKGIGVFTLMAVAGSIALSAVIAAQAGAQPVSTGDGSFEGLPLGAENIVFELEAEGDALYAGPQLVVIDDAGIRFAADNPAFDPSDASDVEVFSVDAAGDSVWVGLGFEDTVANEEQPPLTAAGFAVSGDGGQSWRQVPPPLDQSDETEVTYGDNVLEALPIIPRQESPPLDIAIQEDTVWTANGVAGLRRSTDGGATWERVVLPPDELSFIHPDSSYNFLLAPFGERIGEDSVVVSGLNFISRAVHVDEAGTVWAGSVAGLNRSDAADIDDSGDRAWRRTLGGPFSGSLPGSFIYAIESRPIDGQRDPVWIITRRSPLDEGFGEEESGLAVWIGDTEEGIPVFESRLLGETLYDIAFDGSTVYVAGANGLFISRDGGQNWSTMRSFRDPQGQPLPIRSGLSAFSVDVTEAPNGALWVGTQDGLLRSLDDGESWTLYRASVPTSPANPSDETPEVEAYAYPNPFTPRTDQLCRIRFDLASDASVRVRIFDVGMNLVRELDGGGRSAGPNEVLWNGQTDRGTHVANGAYIYVVDAGNESFSGKILVLQ